MTAVLYIISCIGVWGGQTSAFTRETIGDALIKLIVPSALTVAMIIASAVLFILFPVKEKKKNVTDTKDTRDILAKRISLTECTMHRGEAIVTERNKRAFLRIGAVAVFILSLIYPIIYLFTPDSFGVEDVNTDVLLAALHVILSFIPLTAYGIISSYMIRTSYGSEAELIRAGIKERAAVDQSSLYNESDAKVKPIASVFARITSFFKKNSRITVIAVRCAVAVIGITFVVLGIFNGGMQDVLDKAVKICRECIGLG